MLVLTRKLEECIVIGGTIEVKVLGISGDQVRLGFTAPGTVSIYRKEVYEAIRKANVQAVSQSHDGVRTLLSEIEGAREK